MKIIVAVLISFLALVWANSPKEGEALPTCVGVQVLLDETFPKVVHTHIGSNTTETPEEAGRFGGHVFRAFGAGQAQALPLPDPSLVFLVAPLPQGGGIASVTKVFGEDLETCYFIGELNEEAAD